MILPDRPITFSMLPLEKQAEGLQLLREAIREQFPEYEAVISDEELAAEMASFDLRMVMDEEGLEC